MNDKIGLILGDRFNRRLLLLALLMILFGWLFFKLIYPYPDLVFDSYHYILAAFEGRTVNAWPIGYSWFLGSFHRVSHSATSFVTFQYVFFEFACLLFFVSWRYFYTPSRKVSVLLLILLFCNPLFMFCCNFVMADAIFVALSIVWFTQLLWLLRRPRGWMIISNAVLLVAAFTVRYNALYYPLVSTIAVLFCRFKVWQKAIGILLPLMLVGAFISWTTSQMAIAGGVRQFSAFSGWKLANDALYAYAQVATKSQKLVPDKFVGLDSVVKHYFKTTKNREALLQEEKTSGSPFMFYEDSPLLEYMYWVQGPGGLPFNTRKWMAVAPLYQDYGTYLVKAYPVSFARYFLLPNTFRYFVPPGENLPSTEPFYLHESIDNRVVRESFGFTATTPAHPFIQLQKLLLLPFPAVFAFFHFIFIGGFLAFIFMGGFSGCLKSKDYSFLLILIDWLIDFAFNVISAGVVLRYEIFIDVIEMGIGLYFLEWIYLRNENR